MDKKLGTPVPGPRADTLVDVTTPSQIFCNGVQLVSRSPSEGSNAPKPSGQVGTDPIHWITVVDSDGGKLYCGFSYPFEPI